ncbi:hypothetical protein [Nocardioides speluncae]|uniref:hypothetical protein n=1 Tax=Nocardioides speluncae TaxID=2670337 RepID=UPI000D692594|nr:hypothetical protein [Nocardioides speluncae]
MHQSTRTWRAFTALLTGLLIVVATSLVAAAPAEARATRLSHREAAKSLRAANITWSSTGGCSDRNNPTCTSFSKIRRSTVRGIRTFKRASHCRVHITGATETGHDTSLRYSHWRGWKVDISKTRCVKRYIRNNFRNLGLTRGVPTWRSSGGNVYRDEGDHWDIAYCYHQPRCVSGS